MNSTVDNMTISLGEDCYLDIEQEVIVKDGMESALSRTMFKVLRYLAEKIGEERTPTELIRRGWGKNSTIQKDALYVVIKRIRERLEDDPSKPQCLVSNYGKGYVLYLRKKKKALSK
ncbi:winged helix-turn-helix domain-containing protein [Brevibacillus sp. FIR094]|uniref:winged helix-turn-helix domain-containing protein n=1 Tax=Brevibacillus sp. FIR094 TaxID=3134809 RepID=UPI003D1A9372